MKNIDDFIKKNGLDDKFVRDGAQLRPTKATLEKINTITSEKMNSVYQISALIEENIQSFFLEKMGTKALDYTSVGRVRISGDRADRGYKVKLLADIRVSNKDIIVKFPFAEAFTTGAREHIERMCDKDPLLKIFLSPETLLFREDLHHAICLSVAISNLSKEMEGISAHGSDMIRAIRKAEIGAEASDLETDAFNKKEFAEIQRARSGQANDDSEAS